MIVQKKCQGGGGGGEVGGGCEQRIEVIVVKMKKNWEGGRM